MAKKGFALADLPPFLREAAKESGWALCVGAGVSRPAFPDWDVLVQRLVTRKVGAILAPSIAKEMLDVFTPDAVIQAAFDRSALSTKKFINMLVEELYRTISNDLRRDEFRLFTKCLVSNPGDCTRRDWRQFLDIIRVHYHGMTGLQIAEVVNEVLKTDHVPSAILSFNAEPLLSALIYAVSQEGLPRVPRVMGKSKFIDSVTHSISNQTRNRIPFIYCHGLLPPPIPGNRRRLPQSIDKLVFSESDYLHLSNTSYSWQSSAFINICSTRPVVFVGVSLSDSNMRRWLSWLHTNRLKELKETRRYSGPSTVHYWIRKKPMKLKSQLWVESIVCHLGIRLVWIDDWTQVGEALKRMLGIPLTRKTPIV